MLELGLEWWVGSGLWFGVWFLSLWNKLFLYKKFFTVIVLSGSYHTPNIVESHDHGSSPVRGWSSKAALHVLIWWTYLAPRKHHRCETHAASKTTPDDLRVIRAAPPISGVLSLSIPGGDGAGCAAQMLTPRHRPPLWPPTTPLSTWCPCLIACLVATSHATSAERLASNNGS